MLLLLHLDSVDHVAGLVLLALGLGVHTFLTVT